MTVWSGILAAGLLSLERLLYVWVWHRPTRFGALSQRVAPHTDPVDALHALFWLCKVLQAAVFLGWCTSWGSSDPWPPRAGAPALAAGASLLLAGQLLNLSVFYRLGRVGVFYGNRLGHPVPWCRRFPFSVLKHPQYVGTVLSIWGFFVILRFPHADWFVLPALETAYYAAGAYLEQ